MSHETIASLWSTLRDSQDLNACIRDATGQCMLGSASVEEGSATQEEILLNYALELIAIFDFGRASKDVKFLRPAVQQVTISQTQILSALTLFLLNFRFQAPAKDNKLTTRLPFTTFVVGRLIISAVCSLRAFAREERQTEAEWLVAAAREFVSRLPDGQDEYGLVHALCQYLIREFSPQSIHGQGKHMGAEVSDGFKTTPGHQRTALVQNLVHRALRGTLPSDRRIEAIIDLSHVYSDGEALLIRSCIPAEIPEESGVQFAAATVQAIELRFLIQNCFMIVETDFPPYPGGFRLFMLFTPGLKLSCIQDDCHCSFRQQQSRLIFDLRTKLQSTLLRSAIQKSCAASPMASWPLEYDERVFAALGKRLNKPSRHSPASSLKKRERTTPVGISEGIGLAERLVAPKPPENHQEPLGLSRSSQSSPILPERVLPFSRTPPLPSKDSHHTTINQRLKNFPEIIATRSLPPQPDSRRTSSTCRSYSSPGTAMTASSPILDTESSISTPPPILPTEENPRASFKMPVEYPRKSTIEPSWNFDNSYPELAPKIEPDSLSLFSESSIPVTALSMKTPSTRKWGNLIKSKKSSSQVPFISPHFRFFASGKHILLWTKYGCAYLDPSSSGADGPRFKPIIEADVTHAAGGTSKFVLVSRLDKGCKVSTYRIGEKDKIAEWTLPHSPAAIDISRDDEYLALKYTPLVRLYNLEKGTFADHKLPLHDGNRPGVGNHLVSFSHDSSSFMASTRYQPEKVYSYWSPCVQSPNVTPVIAQSSAPSGDIDDHGLTSLMVSSPTTRGHANGFLSTFTEKGAPAILSMSSKKPEARQLRDPKELVGTRIHSAAMSVDINTSKTSLVIVNYNNDVFWVTDLFGRETDVKRINSLKRPKSLKNEVAVAMSGTDEASVFWIDKPSQTGVLVRVGKQGGKTPPVHFKLDVDPLRSG